jgi:hypothetical protein
VYVDARGDILRVSLAPYLRDDQVCNGVQAVVGRLREFARG